MLRSIVFVVLGLFAFNVSAEQLDATEELKGKLDAIKTLSGEFVQTIKDSKGELIQESKGHFDLKRPGYFLWKSVEPFAQLVVGTPLTLKIYEPDLEQLTEYPRGTNDQNNPAHLLSGELTTLRSMFSTNKITTKKSVSIYKLQPNKSDTAFKEILFQFKGNRLAELTFIDKLDQLTQIVFSRLQSNKTLSDDIFNFVPPKGTDIIVNE